MVILVVEDLAAMRLSYERLFTTAGYTMIWASTALGACELLRTERVDLVILDYELDGTLTGLEVARYIRRLNKKDGQRREVIIVSGFPLEEIQHRARLESINALEGVSFYFPKPLPVGAEVLMGVLKKWI